MLNSSSNRFRERIRKLRKLFSSSENEFVLNDLLSQKTSSEDMGEKMVWLEHVLRWLFQRDPERVDARFRFFLQVLERNPEWKDHFEQTFTSILADGKFLRLFTQVGVAVEHGLWGDVARRILETFLPARAHTDIHDVLLGAFPNAETADSMNLISDETLIKIKALLYTPKNELVWAGLRSRIEDSILYLSTHIAHYGMSTEIRNRLTSREEISKLSFFILVKSLQTENLKQIEPVLIACSNDVQAVYGKMEESGVSVDVVNRLETISALLGQIHNLLKLERSDNELEQVRELRKFLVESCESGQRGRSIVGHVKRHFYLLSRKIVERNGQSGEHYIARNKKELSTLFVTAIGGGCIVVFMTILKTMLIRSAPAPFFLAIGIWIIYTAGFLAMQFTGCTLATKIPSVTASRLAGLLKTIRKNNADDFHSEFKLILKSQSIALLGNLAGAIPLALLINYVIQLLGNGEGLMNEHYANHALHDVNPIFSFAVPLGALTGVELWLSSVAGGWFENWVVFNRIPQAIRNHRRFKKIFGDGAAKKWSSFALKQSSGIATNITLGFLFGFVPVLGTVMGANWNGNHVTISTATASFAISTLGFHLPISEWAFTLSGLVLIATLNFVMSFGLALYIAGKAQNMKFRRVLYYLGSSFVQES